MLKGVLFSSFLLFVHFTYAQQATVKENVKDGVSGE